MVMYKIESIKGKRNKKLILFFIILAVLLIVTAVLAGVKVAEYSATKKQMELAKQKSNEGSQKFNGIEANQEFQNNNEETNNNDEEGSNQEKNNSEGEEENTANQDQNNGVPLELQKMNQTKLSEEQIKKLNQIYNSEEKVAYLTFDDGPSSNITPKILETLKKENIKATFFVLGTMVKSNPEILKQERQEGHYIANHGYSHVYKNIYANEKNSLTEYNKTNKLIQEALGEKDYQSNVFRFPGGSVGGYYDNIKTKAKKILKENGVASLDWNCLTNDSDGANTKDAIMKKLKGTCKGKNSIVILMHDAPNKDLTAETLPDVISYLRKQGYQFKNLYDVL